MTQQTDSIEQDSTLVTHATAIDTTFTLVDWWNQDAKKIDQVSRAIVHQVCLFVSFNRCQFTYEQKPIFTYVFDGETTLQLHGTFVLPEQSRSESLTKSGQAVLNEATGCLQVRCRSGSQLAVKQIKQMNRRLMPSKEWWIGVPEWKKPGGLVTFHMGPYRDPDFHSVHKVA